MKRHATFLKNIAALIMLIALLSLLLPFCKITTGTETTIVSGMEVIKRGASAGYEYLQTGTIANDYVLWDHLTWGEMKGAVTGTLDQGAIRQVVVVGIIAMLPIVFCFLAMVCTLIAEGKKTMVFPTLLIAATFLETIVLMLGFLKLRQLLLPQVDIRLLAGIFAFALLSGVALGILILLWITGGFFKPRNKNDKDEEERIRKKADRSLSRDRKEEKRLKKQNKKDKKKHKRKERKNKRKNKKKTSNRETYNKENRYTQENNIQKETKQNSSEDGVAEERKSEVISVIASGQMRGITGWYAGAEFDFMKEANHTITIGTIKEAVEDLQNGTMKNLDKLMRYNCVITYQQEENQYFLASHSITDILVQEENVGKEFIRLSEGDTYLVGPNTLLYLENESNCIRLE